MNAVNFNMFALLNELSELVYISDVNTYEMIFINESAKTLFGVGSDVSGRKCYEVLQGRSSPCGFCTNSKLCHDKFYTWEIFNRKLSRHYLLKDKLISWNGREARLEIAIDITEKENQKDTLKNALDAEVAVLNCVKVLTEAESHGDAVSKVLENVGLFLAAERTYIFEIRDKFIDNTYEWCAPGVSPQIDNLQGLPISLISFWRESFDAGQCLVITDIEELRETRRDEYEILRAQNIRSLIAAPLAADGRLVGYLGVDNPPAARILHISPLLITLANFITGTMQRRLYQRRLEELSYNDMLTGLYNRNAFIRDVESLSKNGFKSLGIVYVDVNGLKKCNDEYGHAAGDLALVKTAKTVESVFPEKGNSTYRIGGDEFVVLSPNLSEEYFSSLVAKLKAKIGRDEDGMRSFSMGWRWASGGCDIQSLLTEADEQMYLDKKQFYRSKAATKRYRACSDEVIGLGDPEALRCQLDDGRFLVYFQPKVSVADHKPIGAEALTRYLSSEGALIAPDQFISLLENNRLIWMLDFWVFGFVCRKIRQWLDLGKKVLPISVNFSRATISETDFVERLEEAWRQWKVPKELLEIEVTETVELDDEKNFLDIVKRVKEAGFRISIDDFGARYANLSLFAASCFDVLKIDRCLVRDLPDNPTAFAVLKAISDICRKMNIRVIAEGVENERQLNALLEIGCDGLQGFHFSRPIPLEEYQAKYLNAQEGRGTA